MAMSKKTALALARARTHHVKPIVVRTTVVKKPKHHKRRGGGGGLSMGSFLSPQRTEMALAGAAMGYIDKSGWNLPKLPVLGEHGTIAVAAHMLSDNGRNKIAANVATFAIALSAYEFTKTGSISGPGDDDAFGV